jgi:hypothetical protein
MYKLTEIQNFKLKTAHVLGQMIDGRSLKAQASRPSVIAATRVQKYST